jgi:hypothetical protein
VTDITNVFARQDEIAHFNKAFGQEVIEPTASVFFVKTSSFLQRFSPSQPTDVIGGLIVNVGKVVEAIICNPRMVALSGHAQAGCLRAIGHMLLARANHIENQHASL